MSWAITIPSIYSTNFGIEFIANISAKMWNKIPNESKEESSLTVLQSKISRGAVEGTLELRLDVVSETYYS